ncbi:hypothetical protein TIFTF001_035663 [Ficus carica]|uniref:Uncharacterized protein n=1 Tax=Ficus carica TaxID=3494 RepID=A0AA88E2Q8_FICCA|nr:hypothetical protein TIFTF001_035663 [Ficus carica]
MAGSYGGEEQEILLMHGSRTTLAKVLENGFMVMIAYQVFVNMPSNA